MRIYLTIWDLRCNDYPGSGHW